jgi:hypothetical protein
MLISATDISIGNIIPKKLMFVKVSTKRRDMHGCTFVKVSTKRRDMHGCTSLLFV